MIPTLDFNPVLTVFPYALLYYALLLVSSGLALFAVLRSEGERRATLQTSLAVIFVSQLVLLTANLLAYQGVQQVEALFPLLHRSLNLICLVWLTWSIIKPGDNALPAWLPLIVTVLVLLSSAILALSWLPTHSAQNFNFSLPDYIWIGLTLLLILSAGVACKGRSKVWLVEPLLILFIAGVGFILYLLLPIAGDLPAVVMLSQLLYYPLLISLAHHKPTNLSSRVREPEPNHLLRANIANAFLGVSLQSGRDELEKSLSHSLSLYLAADLLGFLSYKEGDPSARLSSAYDLIREDHLKSIDLPVEDFPSLRIAMQNEQILVSNKSEHLRAEKEALMDLTGYNQIGNLLYYPLDPFKNSTKPGILGLTPYTNKTWELEDLTRLEPLKQNLGRALQKASNFEEESAQLQRFIANLEDKTLKLQLLDEEAKDNQEILAQIKNDLEQTQNAWAEEVELWVNRQKELEDELETLQAVIEENRESVVQIETLRLEKQHLEETILRNSKQIEQLKTILQQASLLINGLFHPPGSILNPGDEENPAADIDSIN